MTDARLAVLGAAVGLVATGPLAVLSITAANRSDPTWYRIRLAARPGPARLLAVGSVAVGFTALAALAAGWSVDLPAWLLLALVLAPLAIIDIEVHRLPDRLVLSGYLGGVVLLTAAAAIHGNWNDLGRAALAVVVVLAVFALLAFGGGIGFGDAKLVGLLGGYLGWLGWSDVLGGIFLGFVVGALEALVLIATRRARLRSAIAFGPALMVGALVVAAFG